jgi:Tol biopolymer transport system component
LYRVGLMKSTHLLKIAVVSTAAMLAMCFLTLSWDKPADATLPGENGRIAFSDLQEFPGEDFEIYTMLPDGTHVRQVTDKSGRDEIPTWSPDGTKIGWVRLAHGGQFWIHDVKTGQQRLVASPEGGIGHAVVWSPNGFKLAYTSSDPPPEGLSDIFVVNADGTNKTNLTNTPSVDEWEVNWSPDDSKLAYTRYTWQTTRENQPDIYVMNSDGTNPVNLTDSMPEAMGAGQPNWSPDGEKIAFLSGPREDAPGRSGIYVMNSDGTNPVNITSAATPNLWGPPTWSPDGTKIAFLTCLGKYKQDCNIYVMNADGTDPVNITNKKKGYYGFGATGPGDTLDWQPLAGPTKKPKSERQQEQRQENQKQHPQQGSKSRSTTVHPPDTGGLSLLLVASALLFSGGVLLYAGLKHRM